MSSCGRIESIPSHDMGLRYMCDGKCNHIYVVVPKVSSGDARSVICCHANGAAIDLVHQAERASPLETLVVSSLHVSLHFHI